MADLLGNGKTSRLYKSLVYERRLATEVAAFQQSRELAGFFQIVATAAPGHTLDETRERSSSTRLPGWQRKGRPPTNWRA